MPRPGSFATTPRIVNVACADDDAIADRDAERRQQLRPHERRRGSRAARASTAVALELDGAVERKPRLNGPQLDHLRDRPPVRRPHHRRRLDRFGPRGGAGLGEAAVDRPRAPRRSSRASCRTGRRRRSAPCASLPNTPRTLWMTERSATMAATPTAMQTKKNSSRRHDARVSRTAIRRTNLMRVLRYREWTGERRSAPTPVFSTTRPSRRTSLRVGHRGQLGVVRHEHDRRCPVASWTVRSSSMMWRPLALSRLPVGSSASTIGGSLASARASATRCCSPPDSCDG